MPSLREFIIEKADAQKKLAAIDQDETAFIITMRRDRTDPEGLVRYGWHMIGASISRLALRGLMDEVRDEMLESTMECQCDDPEEEDNDG